jgi:RsiW-degrading membrane proteinase PrsW (M82 family)
VDLLLTFGYAFLGGVLPPLLWLYFLLKEDSRCPEPKRLIALAFFAGMAAVLLTLPLESLACAHFGCIASDPNRSTIVAWALIEETAKYGFAALVVLWRRAVNESIDYVIYLLTVALGFAALENALFFFSGVSAYGLFGMSGALVNNDYRFMGSTLVHVLSSSAIGFSMAFSFMKAPAVRVGYSAAGLILAVALHAYFNFLILTGGGSHTLDAFFTVWTGALVFFALFEVLKYFRYGNSLRKNVC